MKDINKEYIAYNAGCGIWEIELFDENTKWHIKEYRGDKEDCKHKASLENEPSLPHYPNAPYGSIYDY